MTSFIIGLVSGITATMFMVVVMYALAWQGFHHGDMIRVLGSDLTEKPKNLFSTGLAVYFATGLLFSWFYYWILSFFQFDSAVVATGFAAFIGLSQGFILMHFYIEGLGSRHPTKLYQRFWIPVSIAHWFGHLIYGISIGSLISTYLLFGLQGFYKGLTVHVLLIGLILFFLRRNRDLRQLI